MATLRNRRKLAAFSRETPENTRNSQSQNRLDPEMAQEYISQVAEEIEGRLTKNFSKDFSRTESGSLVALSKLDEFLLNSQFRKCSVAVPVTTKNSDSGNRQPKGDRSPGDPCLEAMISSHHSGKIKGSNVEEYPHMVTRGPEEIRNCPHTVTGIRGEIPYHPLELHQENKRRRALQVSQIFAVKTPPRQLKHIKYC